MAVDRRLDRGSRLSAGGRVFLLGVGIAPVTQLVHVALEMRMNVARHQRVAALGRLPVRPVVRQQQNAAEAAVGAFPQTLEMAHAVVRGADTGEARGDEIL